MGKFRDSIHDIILGERLSDNMYLDNNGQLICENVVLARTGSYDYLESELMDDGDPNKVVQVYRTPEEVFNPISIKSMNYKPFVDEHPEENVTPDTVSALQKGFMTNVRRGAGEFSECLMADLVVTDPYVIDEIRSGKKRELSVGYTADIEEIDGKYYMKNIRGNHIALCEAGRAGNARIRDSKTVADKTWSWDELKKYYTGKKTAHGSDIFLIEGKYCTNPNTSNERYNSIAELEKGEVERFRRIAGTDSAFADFEAKGSFDSLDELINFYKGATTEAKDGGIVVRLQSGVKLFYSFLNGTSGKLLFVRRLTDSDGTKVVEVLGDSVKFKEGQRVKYFGTDCVVSRIYPLSGKFFIELTAGGNVAARFTYDQAEESVNAGVLQLRDSVVFDSKSGKFGFADVELDDPAHEKELDRTHYLDGSILGRRVKVRPRGVDMDAYVGEVGTVYSYEGDDPDDRVEVKLRSGEIIEVRYDEVKFVDSAPYKRGDKVKPREGGSVEEIVDIITESTGAAGSGKTTKKYVMKSGRKYTAEDLEGSAWVRVEDNSTLNQGEGNWHKVADDGEGVRRFRVVADGRTFETNANSAAHAAQKVARALRDADGGLSVGDHVRYLALPDQPICKVVSVLGGLYTVMSYKDGARYTKVPPTDLKQVPRGVVDSAVSDADDVKVWGGKTLKRVSGDYRGKPYYKADLPYGEAAYFYEATGDGDAKTVHPYDESDYHWAKSKDGQHWTVVLGTKVVGSFSGGIDVVIKELKRRDKEKGTKRTGGIW